jgi:1-acyl-sn-glycerol-3-phosphate acyltransferase
LSHLRTPRLIRVVRWTRLFAHLGIAVLVLRFLFPHASRERQRRISRWWSRELLALLRITPRFEGNPPPEDGEGVMIAANHISWVDIFLVAAARPARFIAKSEIRDWPIAGLIAQKSGTIFIHRARRHDTARINALVHEAISAGECVGLFPEGTTTEGDRVLKFHSSLFEPAVANCARVFPAAIRYEHPDGTPCRAAAYVGDCTFAQSIGLIIRTREIVACLSFAEPLEPDGRARREVAREAQQRVASLLGLPTRGSAPGTGAGR